MMNLTDAAQKELSRINKLITTEEMKKVKALAVAEQSPSDKMKRAKDGVIRREKELREHEQFWEDKIEREVKELRLQSESSRKTKEKYLRDAQDTLSRLEEEKPKAYVMAELECNKLKSERDKLLSQITQRPTPRCVNQELSLPLPEISINEYEPVSVDMSDFFREGRSDGQELGKSYLDGPFRYIESSLPGIGNLQRRPVQYGAVADLHRKAVAENKS
jgi:hypothetical protein